MLVKTIFSKTIKILIYTSVALLIIASTVFYYAKMVVPSGKIKADNNTPFILDNVHLITMNNSSVSYDQMLVIQDGIIQFIFPAGKSMSDEYHYIDGNGMFVTPGLIDMHVHVLDPSYLKLALSYGVTTVRNMGGFPYHLQWQKQLKSNRWLGSNLITSSPILNGIEFSDPFSHEVAINSEEGRKYVREYENAGYDFIKVYESLSNEVYTSILDEAKKRNISVSGHPSYKYLQENDFKVNGLTTFEHAEEILGGLLDNKMDEKSLRKAAKNLRAEDIIVTPTLAIFDHLTQISKQKETYINTLELDYINPLIKKTHRATSVKRWMEADEKVIIHNEQLNNYLKHIVKTLHKEGVEIVVGSDAGALFTVPGIATHDEMNLLKKSGLSNYEVIQAATVNASSALGLGKKYGKIKEGFIADLVVTSENPLIELSTLTTPNAVIKKGQWLSSDQLQELRKEATNPDSMILSLGRQLSHFF